MKTRSISTFKYNFRAPGSQVEGPIRVAVGPTVLGKVIVGRSQLGLCAIFLGESMQALYDQLAAAFPDIELQGDQASLECELNQVIAQVWQALCGIPAGKTRSYGDVARDLGVPEAVRAVAGACAANVLAIAIPSHRVVRSDGSISGYRWGVERKRVLLAEEAASRAVELAG